MGCWGLVIYAAIGVICLGELSFDLGDGVSGNVSSCSCGWGVLLYRSGF